MTPNLQDLLSLADVLLNNYKSILSENQGLIDTIQPLRDCVQAMIDAGMSDLPSATALYVAAQPAQLATPPVTDTTSATSTPM